MLPERQRQQRDCVRTLVTPCDVVWLPAPSSPRSPFPAVQPLHVPIEGREVNPRHTNDPRSARNPVPDERRHERGARRAVPEELETLRTAVHERRRGVAQSPARWQSSRCPVNTRIGLG